MYQKHSSYKCWEVDPNSIQKTSILKVVISAHFLSVYNNVAAVFMPRWRYVECWQSNCNVSIAWHWSIQTPFRKTSILKVVCLLCCGQTWQSIDSVFLQINIIMLLFRHHFDLVIAIKSQHSLFILGSYRGSDVWPARKSVHGGNGGKRDENFLRAWVT